MKTAIYIEDGTVQLVITPESEFEKNSLSKFSKKTIKAKIMAGSFYDCRGGWIRQSAYQTSREYPYATAEDESLIIRINEEDDDAPKE